MRLYVVAGLSDSYAVKRRGAHGRGDHVVRWFVPGAVRERQETRTVERPETWDEVRSRAVAFAHGLRASGIARERAVREGEA